VRLAEEQKMRIRVSRNTFFVNVILAILKFIAGIVDNSTVMIADVVH